VYQWCDAKSEGEEQQKGESSDVCDVCVGVRCGLRLSSAALVARPKKKKGQRRGISAIQIEIPKKKPPLC
jgi:hypothetical protein